MQSALTQRCSMQFSLQSSDRHWLTHSSTGSPCASARGAMTIRNTRVIAIFLI